MYLWSRPRFKTYSAYVVYAKSWLSFFLLYAIRKLLTLLKLHKIFLFEFFIKHFMRGAQQTHGPSLFKNFVHNFRVRSALTFFALVKVHEFQLQTEDTVLIWLLCNFSVMMSAFRNGSVLWMNKEKTYMISLIPVSRQLSRFVSGFGIEHLEIIIFE